MESRTWQLLACLQLCHLAKELLTWIAENICSPQTVAKRLEINKLPFRLHPSLSLSTSFSHSFATPLHCQLFWKLCRKQLFAQINVKSFCCWGKRKTLIAPRVRQSVSEIATTTRTQCQEKCIKIPCDFLFSLISLRPHPLSLASPHLLLLFSVRPKNMRRKTCAIKSFCQLIWCLSNWKVYLIFCCLAPSFFLSLSLCNSYSFCLSFMPHLKTHKTAQKYRIKYAKNATVLESHVKQ